MEQMNRTELRHKIMTILYQINIYEKHKMAFDVDSVIKEVMEVDNEFVKEMVYGVTTYKNEIIEIANKNLDGWTIDRLGNTDQAILKMSIYELLYTNTPPIVVINEAVELAKEFSDDSVRKMINASLDKIYKENEK